MTSNIATVIHAAEARSGVLRALAELKKEDPGDEATEILDANTLKLASGSGTPREGVSVPADGVVREYFLDGVARGESPQETR